jgi:hypothetical protein
MGICPCPSEGYSARFMPAPEPVHPGVILRERFLAPLGLSSNQVARVIGVLPDSVLRISQSLALARVQDLSESRGQLPRCLAVGRVRFRAVAGKNNPFSPNDNGF